MRALAHARSGTSVRVVIRMAAHISAKLESTICQFNGEHYAVLLGRPEVDPFHVLDAAVMPPMIGPDGRFNQSPTHVQPNPAVIEYFLNVCWLTAGLRILGVIHIHPGEFDQLSGSADGGGDVRAFRAILENSNRQGTPLPHVLALIINLNSRSREARYTGWIVRLDEPRPIPADIVWEDAPVEHTRQRGSLFNRLAEFDRSLASLKNMSNLSSSLRRQAKTLLEEELRLDLIGMHATLRREHRRSR